MTGFFADRRLRAGRAGQWFRRAAALAVLAVSATISWAALPTSPAAGAAREIAATVLLAELPKGFDDYSPPAKSEELPPEPGGGSTGSGGGTTGTGGGTTGGSGSGSGAKLTLRHILGQWCSTSSNYIIARDQLTVILNDRDSRSTYKVTSFDFTATTAIVHWISSDGRRVHTTFGRFSADGKQMVQLAANRTYRRCQIPGSKPLGYSDILGSWCDVDSKYIITRSQLTVVFSGGRRVTYKITGFRFRNDVVEMNWTNNRGTTSLTRFGRYSTDRRSMTQLGANRTYKRC